jgi:thioester reductase-like protein
MSFKRLPEYESVQTVFRLFPELDQYSPGDILSPHPSKPNLWTYGGRTDDLIVLSTGEKFNPIPAELMLKGCSVVKDTLIVGDGRIQAALLVESDPIATAEMSNEEILNELWPFVQRANMALPTQGRLVKTNIIFASAEKEFSRSPKGSVQRKITIARFEAEFSKLYSDEKPLLNGDSHVQLANVNHYNQRGKINLNIDLTPTSQNQMTQSDSSSGMTTPISPRTIKLPTETDTDDTISLSITTESQQENRLPEEESDKEVKEELISESQAIIFIRNILKTICDINCKDNNDDLFELGLDSILALQLSNELQNISATWPQDRDSALQVIYTNPTVKALSQIISHPDGLRSVMANKSVLSEDVGKAASDKAIAQPTISDTMESYAINSIEQLIQTYTANLEDSAPKRTITVALTGSTGAVGSHLLDRLMKEPNVTKVFCLNRAKDGEQAQAIASARNGMSLPSGSKPVEYFTVDLSQPFLGLSPHQYDALQDETDVIVHNAWKLDFLHTVKYFEKTHIAGVRHLINLAANSERRPRIVFLSSIASVLGWRKSQSVPEEIFASATVAGNNGYAQSKHIAERILHEASETVGIQVTVVRLGQIAGPSNTGVGTWNASDWLPQIVSTSKSLGVVPKSLGMADNVDWLPIDSLADVLVDLIHHDLKKPERFQVYHATNPKPVSWASLLPAVCHRLGSDVQLVSYQQWLSILRNKGRQAEDVKAFPALRLMGWLQQLDAPEGIKLPNLSNDNIARSSTAFSRLGPICGIWMENWITAWGL